MSDSQELHTTESAIAGNTKEGPSFVEFLLNYPPLAEDDDFFEIMDQIQADRALSTGRPFEFED